ncbi:MAG: hypothetical protein Q8O32_00435 [bacterium]|nr:hypothetical protein [bacterium]
MKKYLILVLLFIIFGLSLFFILRTRNIDQQIENIKGMIANDRAQDFLNNSYNPIFGFADCVLEYEKKIIDWPLYSDRANCFSIQYPKSWYYYVENNNPLFTVSFDEQEIKSTNYSGGGASIEVRLDFVETALTSNVVDGTMLNNPEISSFNGAQNIRLKGEFKDDSRNEWKYLDRIYIYRNITNQVMTVSYFEKEYSEENREIFNNMLATLKFGQ